jgi:hypothetical protein
MMLSRLARIVGSTSGKLKEDIGNLLRIALLLLTGLIFSLDLVWQGVTYSQEQKSTRIVSLKEKPKRGRK